MRGAVILSLSVWCYLRRYSCIPHTDRERKKERERLLSWTAVHMSSNSPTAHTSCWSRPPTIGSYPDSMGHALRCGLSQLVCIHQRNHDICLSLLPHTLHCLQPHCFDSDNFINKLIGQDQVWLKRGSVDAWLTFADLDFAQLQFPKFYQSTGRLWGSLPIINSWNSEWKLINHLRAIDTSMWKQNQKFKKWWKRWFRNWT